MEALTQKHAQLCTSPDSSAPENTSLVWEDQSLDIGQGCFEPALPTYHVTAVKVKEEEISNF